MPLLHLGLALLAPLQLRHLLVVASLEMLLPPIAHSVLMSSTLAQQLVHLVLPPPQPAALVQARLAQEEPLERLDQPLRVLLLATQVSARALVLLVELVILEVRNQ